MQALVTGATGFLGRRLVRLLCEDGVSVCCLARPTSDVDELRSFIGARFWEQIEINRGSLMQPADLDRALESVDVIFHVAAALSGSASSLFLNTIVPTRKLVDAAVAHGVKRFVHVSSLGVYGSADCKGGKQVDENCPLDEQAHLRDPYTYSKIRQEEVCWEAHQQRGLPLVVIRPGVIFGPGRGIFSGRVGLQLGNWMLAMGGDQTLPYTYVDNCAAAIRQAGFVSGIEGQAFNVIDDDLPTAAHVLHRHRGRGHRLRTITLPRFLIGPLCGLYEWYARFSRGQLPPVITRYRGRSMWRKLTYSNRKAKTLLRWTPTVSMEEALRRSVPRVRSQGSGVKNSEPHAVKAKQKRSTATIEFVDS